MALDAEALARVTVRYLPQVVTLLREARERGAADPRTDLKAAYWTADRRVPILVTRLGIPEGAITGEEWATIVDTAALQM
jgi:hypothetical protein